MPCDADGRGVHAPETDERRVVVLAARSEGALDALAGRRGQQRVPAQRDVPTYEICRGRPDASGGVWNGQVNVARELQIPLGRWAIAERAVTNPWRVPNHGVSEPGGCEHVLFEVLGILLPERARITVVVL